LWKGSGLFSTGASSCDTAVVWNERFDCSEESENLFEDWRKYRSSGFEATSQ
jgi:hypothetical protein